MPPMTTAELREISRELARPFPSELIQFRPSGGGSVAYLPTWAVMMVLDGVAPGWSVSYRDVTGGVEATITIGGVSRADVGFSDGVGDLAAKAAYADALKRAAYAWGVGRFLRAYTPPRVSGQPHDLPPVERQRRDYAAWCEKAATIAIFGPAWAIEVAGDPDQHMPEGVAPDAPSGPPSSDIGDVELTSIATPSIITLRKQAEAIEASGFYDRAGIRARINAAGPDAQAPGFWSDEERAIVAGVLAEITDEAAALGVTIEVAS